MADFNPVPASTSLTAGADAERVSAFLRSVYGWMCAGLGVTAFVAFTVAGSPTMVRAIASNQLLFFGLILAELGLVFYLSARVSRLAPSTAMGLFVLYAALNGVTLSLVLLMYTGASIATTFVVTAGMFGALALFGSTTTRSLAGAGHFFFMGFGFLLLQTKSITDCSLYFGTTWLVTTIVIAGILLMVLACLAVGIQMQTTPSSSCSRTASGVASERP